ncbi:FliH/SctL family protein [Dermatophilus congolensis]|uniref:FliH/SctL family protein n=1 Tax=Dermatophilus congolensis TaxID=1863 RepID=UPI001AAF2686|nr:flagellar assembly protein FliH [Dermatophilus congolensis]MBO3131372.1 flagellar assembly protein FliH [Dermatophilus congolensis]MBO3134472.1 flagellar assembly protein FliH [Dermatophilus congolensis]MBO3136707.1 flagellar assembly protein FliH [Dermatophilus congolensis]MBO3138952.1 flagellar assembly protein FliH [Dermatophilus congolensis]
MEGTSSLPKPNRQGPAALVGRRSGFVLRGKEAEESTRRAVISSDLVMSPFAGVDYADPRLTDPHMHKLVEEAREEGRRRGYEEGHAEGFEDGRVAGLEMMAGEIAKMKTAAEAEAEANRTRVKEFHTAVENAVQDALDYQMPMIEELRGLVGDLAVDIAEELVGHHLAVGECAAVDQVRRALASIPRDVDVTLRVNPQDLEMVTDFTESTTQQRRVRAIADATIAHGDVVATAQNLEVTVTLADAVAAVRKVLHP